jgi:hypothetical protein
MSEIDKAKVEQIREILQTFREEDVKAAISELRFNVEVAGEAPYEIVKMSQLPDVRERTARVVMLDKKMKRRLTAGEEEKIEEIARAEGALEVDLDMREPPAGPAGSTTISGSTIAGSSLASVIARDFGGTCSGGAIFLSDGFYFLYHDADIQKVLSEDLTDLYMWINTYFDCDDFAQVVAGMVNRELKGAAFGTLWFKGPGIYHAVNCFYSWEQAKMKVVEPQTDAIYNFNKSTYCPMLVVI